MDSTTAWAGGFGVVTDHILHILGEAGSCERLKVCTRCGCRRCSCQTRCTKRRDPGLRSDGAAGPVDDLIRRHRAGQCQSSRHRSCEMRRGVGQTGLVG